MLARQPSQMNRVGEWILFSQEFTLSLAMTADGSETVVIVMESASTTPSASLLNLQATCGMPIVAKEWVVQCLVNHKHITNYDQYKVTGNN